MESGSSRLANALQFVASGSFEKQYLKERQGWQLYFDILDAIEKALEQGEQEANRLRERAIEILQNCRLGGRRRHHNDSNY